MDKEEFEYGSLLKNPLWQKKRLEIMQRDNFSCQICGSGINDNTPLNVHHKHYIKGKLPWEYDDDNLITLCEKCHQEKHKNAARKGIAFYRALVYDKSLNPSDKLIISYLLNNPPFLNKSQMARDLNMGRSTVFAFDGRFNVNDDFSRYKSNGFFFLKTKTGLKGELLIFYSWLCDLAGEGKKIFCTRAKLAEMYHIKEENVRDHLVNLKAKGLVKRDGKKKLIIL